MASIPQYTTIGKPRRVGVEIEFIGLDVARSAELVRSTFGGELVWRSDYEVYVNASELGDFRVELDFALLKRIGQERADEQEPPGLLNQVTEEVLAALAQPITPCEIVTAPLPLAAVNKLDQLVQRLHEAGAQGTSDGLWYAFGVHFNPETPATDAATIHNYLRAFVLLYDWLKVQLQVDFTRRVTPYINPYSTDYARLILNPAYRADRTTLIGDYLHYNPTRNKALDMLPLFAEIAPEQVAAAVDDPLIKPRPTFHYRLSNCRVGDPQWRLGQEWAYWLVVEQLAQQAYWLDELAQRYLASHSLLAFGTDWPQFMHTWLQKHQLCPNANP